jgi:hypothetical protein
MGAVLVANLRRPVIPGVSGRVVGIRLGLQISKSDDKHVNANGEFSPRDLSRKSDLILSFDTDWPKLKSDTAI